MLLLPQYLITFVNSKILKMKSGSIHLKCHETYSTAVNFSKFKLRIYFNKIHFLVIIIFIQFFVCFLSLNRIVYCILYYMKAIIIVHIEHIITAVLLVVLPRIIAVLRKKNCLTTVNLFLFDMFLIRIQ